MDSFTHALTGAVIAKALDDKKVGNWGTVAGLAMGIFPDSDFVLGLFNRQFHLQYHRGFTHSILGAAILAVLLAAITYFVGKRADPPKKSSPALDARWLFLVCLIALEGHALMDFTNAYGTRIFLPFSSRWYAWDIMFIFDPLLLTILIAGFAGPALFRLISEEVGAHKPGFRRGAIVSLTLMVLLWGLRDVAHRRVVQQLDSHTYGEQNPIQVGAFPSPANPFDWIGVVETDAAYRIILASALDSDVDLDRAKVLFKPESSPPLEAAEKTRSGTVFLDFARFPWANVQETEKGFDVTIRDLRFYSTRYESRTSASTAS